MDMGYYIATSTELTMTIVSSFESVLVDIGKLLFIYGIPSILYLSWLAKNWTYIIQGFGVLPTREDYERMYP